jgi:hypothetical protein
LAISEFDATLAKFDFSSAKGVKLLFSKEGHDQLRKAHQIQLLKKNSYIIMLQYNQVPLDAMLQEQYRKIEVSAKVFLTERARKKYKEFFFLSLTFRIDYEEAKKALATEDIQQFFMFYNLFYSFQKEQVISRYQERCSLILKNHELNRDSLRRELRSLKFSLIDELCKEMMAELYTYALRTQLVQNTEDIINLLAQIPNSEKLCFVIGKPPKLHHTKTFPAPVKDDDEETPK